MKPSTLATACALALSAGLAFSTSAQAQPISVVGSWSSVSLHKDYELPFWTETLPEASDGRLEVQLSSFDQMGINSADVFRYLSDGLFDIGVTLSDYVVSDAPELEGLDLPMLAVDPIQAEKVSEAFWPIVERTMQSRYGAQALAIAPNTPQVVFCNTPISGLADLRNRSVRASGRSTAEFLDALGARSEVMDFSEVPGAMERGVIDCAVTGSLSGYNAGWYDVATHLLPLPIGGWDHAITAANGDFWSGLSTEDQTLIATQARDVFAHGVWSNIADSAEQGIACLTGEGECRAGSPASMTLVATDEADLETAKQILSTKLLPAWASRVDADTRALYNQHVAPLTGLSID